MTLCQGKSNFIFKSRRIQHTKMNAYQRQFILMQPDNCSILGQFFDELEPLMAKEIEDARKEFGVIKAVLEIELARARWMPPTTKSDNLPTYHLRTPYATIVETLPFTDVWKSFYIGINQTFHKFCHEEVGQEDVSVLRNWFPAIHGATLSVFKFHPLCGQCRFSFHDICQHH